MGGNNSRQKKLLSASLRPSETHSRLRDYVIENPRNLNHFSMGHPLSKETVKFHFLSSLSLLLMKHVFAKTVEERESGGDELRTIQK